MNRIVNVLMQRDGMTKDEAMDAIAEAREMMQEAVENGYYNEAEDIMMDFLGLEMDYIFDIM